MTTPATTEPEDTPRRAAARAVGVVAADMWAAVFALDLQVPAAVADDVRARYRALLAAIEGYMTAVAVADVSRISDLPAAIEGE